MVTTGNNTTDTALERAAYIRQVAGDAAFLVGGEAAMQKTALRQELERLAGLVAENGSSGAVTADCNQLLDEAGRLLTADTPDAGAVLSGINRVKQRLVRAYDSRHTQPWFFPLITAYNLVWLFALAFLLFWYSLVPGQPHLEDSLYVCLACAVWGGLGGIADAFFALHGHIAAQDFDTQYWPWYYLHPFLGLGMGAVVFLVLQAGLLAVSGLTLQETPSPSGLQGGGTALPVVLAFLAGFRQRTMTDLLTRIISAVFQKDATGSSRQAGGSG